MFVIRLRGYHYDSRGEVQTVGWLTKDGGCTTLRCYAQVFTVEDDAWAVLGASGEMGHDSGGEWAWVEAAELSAALDRAPVTRINGEPVEGVVPFEVPYTYEE